LALTKPPMATDTPPAQPSPDSALAAIPVVPLPRAAGRARPGIHIPSLDGIRAFSFLLVFTSHAGLGAIVPGGFGVTVFFFLSGFLITTLLRLEFERTATISVKHFYARRALRILPPFYIVLSAALILSVTSQLGGDTTVIGQLMQFGHVTNFYNIVHGFGGQVPGTGVYWSLAVEEHFYFAFPLMYITMRHAHFSTRRQVMVLLGLCTLVLVWRVVLVFVWHASILRTSTGTDTRVDSILFGCLLAIGNNPHVDGSIFPERALKHAMLPVAVIALLGSFLVRNVNFQETARYSVQGLALYVVFSAAIMYPDWSVFRILNQRLIMAVGTISYTLYLVHQILLFGISTRTSWSTPVVAGMALAASLVIATAVHVAVERPLARWRRRLSASPQTGDSQGDLTTLTLSPVSGLDARVGA
jgi:peptidoglycan/LPS O-acetylase OafA/YrhL